MKRQPLVLASIGGAAVLATIGATLGVAAADDRPSRTVPLSAGAPATTASPDDSATPGGGATGGAPAGAVDEQRAREIALAATGGGRVVDVEAESEHGRPVWDVEIVVGGVEHEIDVDRETAAVVRHEQDDDDDDRHGDDDGDDGHDDDDDDDRDDDSDDD